VWWWSWRGNTYFCFLSSKMRHLGCGTKKARNWILISGNLNSAYRKIWTGNLTYQVKDYFLIFLIIYRVQQRQKVCSLIFSLFQYKNFALYKTVSSSLQTKAREIENVNFRFVIQIHPQAFAPFPRWRILPWKYLFHFGVFYSQFQRLFVVKRFQIDWSSSWSYCLTSVLENVECPSARRLVWYCCKQNYPLPSLYLLNTDGFPNYSWPFCFDKMKAEPADIPPPTWLR